MNNYKDLQVWKKAFDLSAEAGAGLCPAPHVKTMNCKLLTIN
jgi:hypothetical protein